MAAGERLTPDRAARRDPGDADPLHAPHLPRPLHPLHSQHPFDERFDGVTTSSRRT